MRITKHSYAQCTALIHGQVPFLIPTLFRHATGLVYNPINGSEPFIGSFTTRRAPHTRTVGWKLMMSMSVQTSTSSASTPNSHSRQAVCYSNVTKISKAVSSGPRVGTEPPRRLGGSAPTRLHTNAYAWTAAVPHDIRQEHVAFR